MILAALTDIDDKWLGNGLFNVLPRIGEQIVIPADRYEVVAVEHWPELASVPINDAIQPRIRIRVKDLPLR